METPLQKAVNIIGGQPKLARLLTEYHRQHGDEECCIYQSHVWKWINKTKQGLPAEHCRAIEDITNGAVTRYELRPDVFGASAECECNQTTAAGAAPLGTRPPGCHPCVEEAA